MARLNVSGTPDRESSVYRGRTPYSEYSRRTSSRRGTSLAISPALTTSSDKENEGYSGDPPAVQVHGKGRMDTQSLSVSNSASSMSNKRRRLGERGLGGSREEDESAPDAILNQKNYYDPDQNLDERRELRKKMRENHRTINDNKDQLDASELKRLIQYQDSLMGQVKQTSDATIDSRFLLNVSGLALKKTTNQVLGDGATGIDVDEFVSKCITFMRNGGSDNEDGLGAPLTQSRRTHRSEAVVEDDDVDEDDEGDALNWEFLGSQACFQNNKRPAVAGFLLGPLSLQKRARTVPQRRGRLQRDTRAPEQRPQSVEPSDLQKAENSNLATLCTNIRTCLIKHIENGVQSTEDALSDDYTEEEATEIMRRYRISRNKDGEPCASLFEFAINPSSFGQTIENLFYISFIIREGSISVGIDSDGLPVISPSAPRGVEEQRQLNVSKHQAILSLDWPTWKKLIKAFGIRQPLIPHRNDEEGTQVSSTGWYG